MQAHQTISLPKGAPRRWLLFVMALSILAILGFYNAGNFERLSHDHGLNGGDMLGAAVCHRITARSFTINGRSMPLCARCSGIYLGIFLAFALLTLSGRSRLGAFPPLPILVAFVGLVGIMGVDGINSYSHFFPEAPHLYTPRNWLRVLTGTGTGLTLGVVMFAALAQTLWQDVEWRPAISNWQEFGLLLGLGLIMVGLILSNQPIILYVLALLSVAGIIMVFAGINAILALILFKQEGKLTSWRQAAVPLAFGAFCAIVELGAIAYFRLSFFGTIAGIPGI